MKSLSPVAARVGAFGALVLLAAVAACGSGATSRGSEGSAGAGSGGGAGAAGAGGATGGRTGGSSGGGISGNAGTTFATGGGGGSTGGAGGAAGQAGATSSAGAGGAPMTGAAGGASGAGGGAPNVGPPGPDGFSVTVQLASDIKPTAPSTVAIVRWSVSQPGLTAARIDFGLDTTYGMTAPVDLTRASYRTVLVGMKPTKTYHFRIVATDGAATYTSDDRTLTTGAPFGMQLLRGFDVKPPSKVDKGFFVTSYWNPTSINASTWMAFILDTDGDVVWWYQDPADNAVGEPGIGRARLSADSQDVWIARVSNRGAPLRRISIDGLEEQKYTGTVGSHDIAAVSGGTMAYLDYGEPDCNSIFEIDKAGVTKEVFEATGVTSPDGTCHGNSVRYSMKDDVYVFSDNKNDVVVVGRDGAVKWKLADKVSGGNDSWGGYQHGTHLLDDGLLILANRVGGDAFNAQAIEFGLVGSVKRKFTNRSSSLFMGDVQRLPSGNTLITYSTGQVIQEVDANDAVVLEIAGTNPFGYVEFRQSLYGLPLDIQQ